MMLSFYKKTGAGKDYVMVDNRDLSHASILTSGNIAGICNRRFERGAGNTFPNVTPTGPALIVFRSEVLPCGD